MDFRDVYRFVGRATILDLLWNKFSRVKFQMEWFVKRLLLERFVIHFANWKCLQPIVPFLLSSVEYHIVFFLLVFASIHDASNLI